MKIKNLFIITLLTCNTVSNQAGILSPIKLAIITSITYTTLKLYKANGNFEKAQRAIRKDRDFMCNHTIEMINKNCNHDLCKKISSALEQSKTTTMQRADDAIQETLQNAQETELGKVIKTTIEKQIDQINKPKK